MQRLQEYRDAAFTYLSTRIKYFNSNVDAFLDAALRSISKLPEKPVDHDNYNGLLGMRPVLEQRKICLKILLKRIIKKEDKTTADYLVDTSIRLLNTLPARPEGQDPYVGLFKLPAEKEVSKGYNDLASYKVSEEGIDLIHSFESYRRCTYKDPGSKTGLPITGCVV